MLRTKAKSAEIVYAVAIQPGDKIAHSGRMYPVTSVRTVERGDDRQVCVTLAVGRTNVHVWLHENLLVPIRRAS